MTPKITKYPSLLATLAVLALVTILFSFGAISMIHAIGMVILWQLALHALSPRQAICFVSALTGEQVTEWEGIMRSLSGHAKMLQELPAKMAGLEAQGDATKKAVDQLRKGTAYGRKSSAAPGYVSDECAGYIGSIALGVAVKRGFIVGAAADTAQGVMRNYLGAEFKSALTSSDIPLPVEYSGQVVELVGLYGSARKYGTVYPLSGGTVKLPKLTTDTTFGLITASGTVTEKSPQAGFVTFTAEKFGGLVRIPNELEEDSIIPLGQFIARYAARNIARAEDTNFFVGTGADSGINGAVAGLTFSTITNSKVVQMGSGKTANSQATLANFRALRAVPDSSAIRNGAYYLHPTMEQLLASFNTAGDRPYNPNAQLNNPGGAQPFINGPTLDGFPIRWVDVMPAYSASPAVSTVFALFGDASFQYLGIRGGVRFDTSMEAGFTTDEILIRALERFTIGLMANGAMGGLETAAS